MKEKIKFADAITPQLQNKILDTTTNNHLSHYRDVISQTISKTNNLFRKELEDMYRFYITDFYKYRTKSYSRHGEGIGTGTGWVLYEGGHFIANNKHSYGHQTLFWDFYYTGDMLATHYQYDSAERVLWMVLHGTRFMAPHSSDPDMESLMTWSCPTSYRLQSAGINISNIENIYMLYQKIDKNFDKIADQMFSVLWNEQMK